MIVQQSLFFFFKKKKKYIEYMRCFDKTQIFNL